jgi:cytochrome c551/c552
MVARHIREGLGGAWGDARMPAQAHVSPAEAEALAKWVLRR